MRVNFNVRNISSFNSNMDFGVECIKRGASCKISGYYFVLVIDLI